MSYENNLKTKLIKESKYITQKINSETLTLKNYISTENMLSNKLGVTLAKSIPEGNVNNFLKNDILISNIRPYFKKIWYAKFDGGASSDVLIIRSNKEIFSKYLYYVLKDDNFFDYNMKGSKGTKMPRGDKTHIMNYTFLKPKLLEQIAIANILSSLDDKIELNNKMNETLEELAQTLYKQWFVDFEFPNEKGEPYKSSGGKMVDSELGLIPDGWTVSTLGENTDTILGGTPSRKISNYWGKGFDWIKSGELNNLRIIKGTEKITPEGLEKSAAKMMPIGTVLIGITGYVGVVSMLEIESSANQSVIGLIPNVKMPRSYLYSLIKNEAPIISLKQTGSAQQHINKNDINTHKFIKPTTELIKTFSTFAESLNKSIALNLFENETLVETRDLLLPKLMSGEIRVPVKD